MSIHETEEEKPLSPYGQRSVPSSPGPAGLTVVPGLYMSHVERRLKSRRAWIGRQKRRRGVPFQLLQNALFSPAVVGIWIDNSASAVEVSRVLLEAVSSADGHEAETADGARLQPTLQA